MDSHLLRVLGSPGRGRQLGLWTEELRGAQLAVSWGSGKETRVTPASSQKTSPTTEKSNFSETLLLSRPAQKAWGSAASELFLLKMDSNAHYVPHTGAAATTRQGHGGGSDALSFQFESG